LANKYKLNKNSASSGRQNDTLLNFINMKKHTYFTALLAIALLFIAPKFASAQSISAYTYGYTAGYTVANPTAGFQLINMTNPVYLITSATPDNTPSALTNIGFDFWYMGVAYTQFSVDDNGLLKLGSPVMTSEPVNSMASAINLPKIAPYWDDLSVGLFGYVSYSVEGTAPSRKLVVQWRVTIPKNAAAGPDATFQLWLSENTGAIEFVYGNGAAVNSNFAANPAGFSVGIGSSAVDFGSISVPANTNAFGTANDGNTVAPGYRSKYAYIATKPLAPSTLSFTNVTLTGMDLNWTDNATNEVGYVVYKSTDGVNYSQAALLPANAVTASITGLSAGVSYSWKVYSFKEVLSDPLSGVQATTLTPFSGIKTIGPTGDYPSITVAVLALQGSGFAGPSGGCVFELQSTYNSNVETYPITFTSAIPTTSANQLTIRPETGATGLVITNGSANAHTIYINGGHHINFDGRPGGLGSTSQLSITSGLTGSYLYNTVRFLNASNNAFRYCDITSSNSPQSSSPWAPGAVIWLATGTGNNDNTFDHCSVHGVSNTDTGIACTLLYALSSPNLTISNCNFYDFGPKNNGYSYAILLGTCNGSFVTDNSFYQTGTRTINYGTHFINLNGGYNYTITGNYIGGSAPLCGGTPMLLTMNSSSSGSISVFTIQTANTQPSSIQGNTIQNIQATFNQTGSFTVFSQSMGNVNIGTVTPNLIGSETVTNSIALISNAASADGSFSGLTTQSASSTDFTTFSNNVFSGIAMTTTAGRGITFTGVNAGSFYTANLIITNNKIGSPTLANSISSTTPGNIIGINGTGRNLSTFTGNTIANITQTNTGSTTNQVIGIQAIANPGLFNITGNTIKNISSASTSTGIGSAASIIGISCGSYNTAGQIVSQNTIENLSNTAPSSVSHVIGIYYTGPAGSTNIISRNFIHSLNMASSDAGASITGIYTDAGQYSSTSQVSVNNNMIRLGIDASGTSIGTGCIINGINDFKGSNSFNFNSVYIGGTVLAGTTANTFAYNSAVLTNTRAIQNNIFVNARTGGATGKHYAVTHAGTTQNPAGVTAGFNILYAPGAVGGNIGLYNGATLSTLTAWQAATGLDATSASADPKFINPLGNSSTVDLHEQSSNPIEASGLLIASITDDFDGETRSGLTPTDIGADAGNFTNSGDIFAPSIAFTPIANTASTANLTLTGFGIITDNVGVATGANLPRLYYKKATDADAFAGNTSAANGWKYTVATNSASPFDFVMDYSIINGGSVAPGDNIQYFIVAQDAANNFTSKAVGATASSATNPVQNINGAPLTANLNSFIIINSNMTGTYTIPGSFSSITGTGGLFQAINAGTVTGNMTVIINGNTTEDGTYALNQWTENPPASNFTLTIAPGSASVKSIAGNLDNAMIRFNGADRVTIDGRYSGSGKYLDFYNSNTGASANTFLFINDATYNTIKYSAIKGVSSSINTTGIIYFSTPLTPTGNAFNTIDNCDIFNPGTGNVSRFINEYNGAPMGSNFNTNNTISNCNIYDYFSTAGASYAIYLAWGTSGWTISGNSFYQTVPRAVTNDFTTIYTNNCSGHSFINNYFGGTAPLAGGTPLTLSFTGAAPVFRWMYFANTPSFTVQGNTFTNMAITGSSSNYSSCIYVSSGGGSIIGNTIGSTTGTNAITISNGTLSTSCGMYILAGTNMIISNNNIGGITTLGATTSVSHGFIGISCATATGTFSGNVIGSLTVPNSILAGNASTNASGQSITGIMISGLTGAASITDNTVVNLTNNYAGTGTAGSIKGISVTGTGPATMTGNQVYNLSNSSPQAGTGASASIIGIYEATTATGKNISMNTIHTLENTAATGATCVTGLHYVNSTTGTNIIGRNQIYGLNMLTTNTAAAITGIYIGAAVGQFENNIIRLGTTTAGADINTGYSITGIYDSYSLSSVNLYYNTVIIGGAAVTGVTSNTYVLNSLTTGNRNFVDNIFVNTRSGGTTGKHYGIKVAGTAAGQANLALNYNDYFVNGTNGVFGFFNSLDVASLAAWKTAVGKDVNSISADPVFTSATNLIPQTGSPVIAAGTPVTGITADYAGTARPVTPTIGAYEAELCVNPTSSGSIAADQTGCSPFTPATLTSTAAATGFTGTLEYKWQSSVSPFTTWVDIPSSNSATYSPGALTETTKFKRVARVSCKVDWSAALETAAVTITVNPQIPVSISIVANQTTVCAGTSVTFTATPVNEGTAPLYQWLKNGSPVGTSATTYTYAPANNDQISCVLTSNAAPCATGNPATSNTVTITVNPLLPVSISIFPSTTNPVCAGSPISFFAAPVNPGATPAYQWKVNGINAGSNMNTYTYNPVAGDAVTCVLTSNALCPSGNPATSNTVSPVVSPLTPVSATITPSANPVCSGASVTYTVNPVNGGTTPTFAWKVNGGATVSTAGNYTYTPASGDVLSCIVTSNASCPSDNPYTATFSPTVNPNNQVAVNITAGSNPVCPATSVTYTANLTNGGVSPTYEWHVNGGAAVGTAGTYTYTPVAGDVVSCIVVSSESCPVINTATGTFTPTVNPILTLGVTVTASVNPVCSGSPVTYTANVTDGGATPLYEWHVNGGASVGTNSTYTYNPASGDLVSCIVTSGAACPANSPATGTMSPTVEQAVAAAGAISGSSSVIPGSTGVAYSVAPIANATSYVWSYSGTGVTINGTGASVTIDFSLSATSGNLTVQGTNSCGGGTVSAAFGISLGRTLNLSSVMLEGLYNGAGTMRQASNETGPLFPAGIADQITVELHNTTYSSIAYTATNVNLHTDGTVSLIVPANFNGSYYITIKHRNSLETTTSAPIAFSGSTVTKSFASPSDIFGGNVGTSFDNHYYIYGGDVNQDGFVDLSDMAPIDNLVSVFGYGQVEDVNSDGLIDISDMAIVDNNTAAFIYAVLP